MKRLPNWLKIVLAAFGVLFMLGAVFGKEPEPKLTAATPPAPAPTSTTSATPTLTPVAVTYTVETVTDGADVVVNGSDGTRKTIRVLGVIAPVTTIGCYAAESLTWATTTLSGKTVQLGAETVDGVALTLAGGQDYATLALQSGYLKYATSAAAPTLQAAENTAHQAVSGLWAAPCNGTIDAPAPTPTPSPTPVPQPPAKVATKAAPKPPPAPPTTEDAPAPDQDSAAYYKNCTAAKAAGAAPLYRGEPGYRAALDRDGDGVACER
ncbi:excalibur calcium-binding domain-containing protein [Amycolatopsis sp. NBC_00355]|uniref:thermonuclease family protein n=1 Tax=Amycolatopsis sp. NBC_00355 TaxID=2975957 RepID=UPI002E2639D3